MKSILFNIAAFDLSETSQAIAVAKAISADFHCYFASHGGDFVSLIEKEGFQHFSMEPEFTPQTIEQIFALDQFRRVATLFTAQTVRQMVTEELNLFKSLQPAAVVTGMDLTSCIACPAAQIPLVWYLHSGMVLNKSGRAGALKNMDLLDAAPIRWAPDGVKAKLSEILLDFSFALISGPYNQVAAEYGLKPYRSFDEVLFRSHSQLVAEPPGFSDLTYPASAYFIGPLIARLDVPLPQVVIDLPQDFPIVYFAMGSADIPELEAGLLEGFEGKPYRVIAPVKRLLGLRPTHIPENVLVTGWLPALEVNQLADIAVIHGGIGTVMTACLAGKPTVGIAKSVEQCLNLDRLAQKGFAVRIPRRLLNSERLCETIDQLLNDPVAQEKARSYQAVAKEWDQPERIRQFFLETFGRNL